MKNLILSLLAICVVSFLHVQISPPKVSVEAPSKAVHAQKATKTVEIPPEPVKAPEAPLYAPGSCEDWMTQAGVTDMVNARQLIHNESKCRPGAVNPSSGACGIGQQLPCGKWAHTWNDPVGGIIDMQAYVIGKYGSWATALAFWNRTDPRPYPGHWY